MAPTAEAVSAALDHIDHVALAQPFDYFDEAALFYRSVLGLRPLESLELSAPNGLVRSRAVTNVDGSVRLALNVPVLAHDTPQPAGLHTLPSPVTTSSRRSSACACGGCRCSRSRPTTTTTSPPAGISTRTWSRRCASAMCSTTAVPRASSCTSTRRSSAGGCSLRSSSGEVAISATGPRTRRSAWPPSAARRGRSWSGRIPARSEHTIEGGRGRPWHQVISGQNRGSRQGDAHPQKAAVATGSEPARAPRLLHLRHRGRARVGKVFFPAAKPATGTLLSMATNGVAYVARPVGAVFMGISATRRRSACSCSRWWAWAWPRSWSGACATYADIGVWAPCSSWPCALRGLAASGEQAGANSVSLEHAPDRRRAFYTSFTLGGTQAGLVIATALWLPISTLPSHELLTWGWRIPFWLSAVVAVTGVVIRRRLDKSPAFRRAADEQVLRAPLTELLSNPPRRPAARRPGRAGLDSEHDRQRLRAVLRGGHVGVNQNDDALGPDRLQPGRSGGNPAWPILADHMAESPVFIFGRAGQRSADGRVPGRDRRRRSRRSSSAWPSPMSWDRLQRATGSGRRCRRDVPHAGTALRHGDRDPDRVAPSAGSAPTVPASAIRRPRPGAAGFRWRRW